jgi:structural maintenance of chromosome 1
MEEMDVDETDGQGLAASVSALACMRSADWPIELDFDRLDSAARQHDDDEYGNRFDDRLAEIAAQIERIAPNLRALER